MRFLITLAALTIFAIQPAQATSMCASAQYVLSFEPNSTALTSEARETLETAYLRARQCTSPVFTLLASGADPIGRARARLLEDELHGLGLSVAVPIYVGIDEAPADPAEPPNHVIVTVEFDN